MAEKQKSEIVLHNLDSYAVQLLIEYSYTGDVTITGDNVQVGTVNFYFRWILMACICYEVLDKIFAVNC